MTHRNIIVVIILLHLSDPLTAIIITQWKTPSYYSSSRSYKYIWNLI